MELLLSSYFPLSEGIINFAVLWWQKCLDAVVDV